MDSYEINLIDLLKQILKRWRMLIVCALIACIGMTCFGVYKNYSNNQSIRTKEEKTAEESDISGKIEEVDMQDLINLTGLKESQINDVRMAVQAYNIIEESYLYLEDEYDFDTAYPYNVILQYVIKASTDSDVNSNSLVDEVAESLVKYIDSKGMALDIESENKGLVSLTDLKNAIRITLNNNNNNNNNNSNSNSNSNSDAVLKNSIPVFITCKGKTEEQLNTIIGFVKYKINTYVSKFSSFGACSITLVHSYTSDTKDTNMRNEALDDISSIMSAKATYNSIIASFDEEQKALFNAYVQKDVLKTKVSLSGAIIYSDAKPVALTNGLTKNVVLGIVSGIVFACIVVIFSYILSGTIKTKSDLVTYLGYYCLGNISIAKGFSGFGSKIDKCLVRNDEEYIYSLEDRQELLLTNIKAICKKDAINQIVLSSTTVINEDNKTMIAELIEKLKLIGINAIFGGNVLTSVEGFNQMAEVKNLIILEKINESKLKDIENLSAITKEYDVNVLGFICI